VNLTFAAALAVGAVLVAFGAFTAAWRRDGATSLAAIPMLAAGAAICMAGASRFSAAPGQAVTGQEFAAMITMVGLAAAIVGRAFSARGVER
jgi:NADH:ubiquinone oxidoreductase subunit K